MNPVQGLPFAIGYVCTGGVAQQFEFTERILHFPAGFSGRYDSYKYGRFTAAAFNFVQSFRDALKRLGVRTEPVRRILSVRADRTST